MQKVASNKVNKDLLKEYISFIPKSYKFKSETAKKVFAVIYHYSKLNDNNSFTLGQETIAFETGLSTKQIGRTVKLLANDYNYLNYQRGYTNTNSTYTVLIPSESIILNQMSAPNVSTQMSSLNVPTQTIENEVVNPQMSPLENSGDVRTKCPTNNNINNNINNNFNFNNNTNMVNNKENSVYSNNSINLKEMELIGKLLERIEVLESNQNKTTLLIENLINNFTTSIENKEISKLTEKVLQLEEEVEKKSNEITHLNERLDKAGKLFVELRKSVYTSTSTVGMVKESIINTTSNIENSKNSTSTTSSGKSEYIQAIDKFYKSKNSKDFEKAEEALDTLNSLVEEGKLNDYQIRKVADCKKYFEEEKAKGTTNNTTNIDNNNFYTLQNNFYKTLNGKGEDKFDSLTTTLKELEELKLSDSKQKENLKKIEEIYVKTLGGEVRSYYFKEFKAYRNAFKIINQKGDKDKLYELAKRFCDYLNSLKKASKTLLKSAQLENAVNYENGLWDNDITSFKKEYEKEASLSLQKIEGGTTAHTDTENRSEGLKSGKNGVISVETVTVTPQNKAEGVIFSPKKAVDIDSVEAELDDIMSNLQQGQTPNYDMNF
jgi:RNA binding exosome subunit